jgi:hypothetical protein
VSAGRPLLVVEYRVEGFSYDQGASRRWLEKMTETLSLVGETRIPVRRHDQHQRRLLTTDEIVLRRFVPR